MHTEGSVPVFCCNNNQVFFFASLSNASIQEAILGFRRYAFPFLLNACIPNNLGRRLRLWSHSLSLRRANIPAYAFSVSGFSTDRSASPINLSLSPLV